MHSEEWEKMVELTKEEFYKNTNKWDGVLPEDRDLYNKLPNKIKKKLNRD